MPTSADSVYLDSSAVVKLVIREPETDALVLFLARHPRHVSCALIRVEVLRAVRRHGPAAVLDARTVLSGIAQERLNDALLDVAADIGPQVLRSLDAIHLAAAWRLGPNAAVVTYDHRLGDAARSLGMRSFSPGI